MENEELRKNINSLPSRGIYALLIWSEEKDLPVGSLGTIHFREGYYVYIGSAQKNLRKRMERHLKKKKKMRWHIDYFLLHAKLRDIMAAELPKIWEERIALILAEKYSYVEKFGAGDSSAPSHLFFSPNLDIWEFVRELLKCFATQIR